MINVIKYKKYWLLFSGFLVSLSIIFLLVFGLRLGIDFTGGSIGQVDFNGDRPSVQDINRVLNGASFQNIAIQHTGEKGIMIRTKELTPEEHEKLLELLKENYGEIEENSFETIGPVIGEELKKKSLYAIVAVVGAIILYIAYVFRRVSKSISSWKLGVAAVIALLHDIIIVTGIYAVLGYFFNVDVGTLFVTALLLVLGYSVNDTIIVFDRVRENLINETADSFDDNVNLSINQTITRSLNTSITTVLVLLALFLFGGESIKYFVLALIFGIVIGTYSSIFLASPILVYWHNKGKK